MNRKEEEEVFRKLGEDEFIKRSLSVWLGWMWMELELVAFGLKSLLFLFPLL